MAELRAEHEEEIEAAHEKHMNHLDAVMAGHEAALSTAKSMLGEEMEMAQEHHATSLAALTTERDAIMAERDSWEQEARHWQAQARELEAQAQGVGSRPDLGQATGERSNSNEAGGGMEAAAQAEAEYEAAEAAAKAERRRKLREIHGDPEEYRERSNSALPAHLRPEEAGGGMEAAPPAKHFPPRSPATEILENAGPEGLADYLEQHPQSPRRIQGEMKGVSLLGRAAEVEAEYEAADAAAKAERRRKLREIHGGLVHN